VSIDNASPKEWDRLNMRPGEYHNIRQAIGNGIIRTAAEIHSMWERPVKQPKKEVSDGSSANYYTIPFSAITNEQALVKLGIPALSARMLLKHTFQVQDLISYKNMNAQIGEIFRAALRYGEVGHSSKLRDAKKMEAYAKFEQERLDKYGE